MAKQKWERSRYWRDAPQRAVREADWLRSGKGLSGTQAAEQRREAEVAWAAYRRRLESAEAYAEYEAAYRDHWIRHGHTLSNIAIQVYLHAHDGKSFDIEPLVAYLERDFREPRSHYVKKHVVQALEGVPLPENLRARLQHLLLAVVDGQKQSDVRGYGGLSNAVDTPAFRDALYDRAKNDAGSIRRRALQTLQMLDTRAGMPSRPQRQSDEISMKKWQRLEHRWDTRQRAERDKKVAQAEVSTAEAALTDAQVAERQRDYTEVWAAYNRRGESPEAYTEFEAVRRRHGTKYGRSETSIAFREVYQRMLDRIPVDAEPFIAYLEHDVWEFRSGYVKARVIQFLKSASLSESERARLRQVALHIVDGRDRREFRRYGNLARVVDAPELHAALHSRLKPSCDAGIRRRAAWMLYAIGERSPELEAWQQ